MEKSLDAMSDWGGGGGLAENSRRMRLISLELTNFKGLPHLLLEFGGRGGRITGANGAGKTSVYDGLTWLLYGKDSQGRERFDIKPLGPDGKIRDRRAVTKVEGVLTLGERTLRLGRSYYEKWAKRRGTEVFEGNGSDYFIDGVAMSRTDYDRTVGALLGEDRFRLLTNAAYFPGDLGWRERREILFEMAKVCSDRELMERQERFLPLLQAMDGASLDGFRKKLEALRRSLISQRGSLPHRISENEKHLQELEGSWGTDPEGQLEALSRRKQVLEGEILIAGQEAQLQRLSQEEQALRASLRALEAENEAFALEGRRQESRWEAAAAAARDRLSRAGERKAALTRSLEDLKRDLQEGEPAEKGVPDRCPLCGGALSWEARQRLEQKAGEQNRKRREQRQAQLQKKKELEKELLALEQTLLRENQALSQAEEALFEQRQKDSQMPGYRSRREDLQEQLEGKRALLAAVRQEGQDLTLEKRRELEKVEKEMDALRQALARRSLSQDCRSRIAQLGREAEELEEAVKRTENMQQLCLDFLSYKASQVEQQVNSLFSITKFRLYRPLVGGGLEDCCDATYQGVPYESLNSGAKINLGLDIIGTLSSSFGQWVPLFVDNAESVTELFPLDTQVLRLEVGQGPLKVALSPEG